MPAETFRVQSAYETALKQRRGQVYNDHIAEIKKNAGEGRRA
jgi:hypothetical protein